MRDGSKVHRNSYSLINGGYGEGLAYFIAVQLAPNSKGGSKYMHEKVKPGTELTISVPANYFPTAEHAVKHLLVAGGIGITQRRDSGVRPVPWVPGRPECPPL
jgi:ferredoxin-NADP reductase